MAILKSDVNRRGVSQAGIHGGSARHGTGLAAGCSATRRDRNRSRQCELAVPSRRPRRSRTCGRFIRSRQRPKGGKASRSSKPSSAPTARRRGQGDPSIGEDLDNAAIDAVLQLGFTPTTLNGRPVPVIMTVTVNFSLDSGPDAASAATSTDGPASGWRLDCPPPPPSAAAAPALRWPRRAADPRWRRSQAADQDQGTCARCIQRSPQQARVSGRRDSRDRGLTPRATSPTPE